MRAAIAVFAATLVFAEVALAEPAARDDVRAGSPSEEAKGHFESALVLYREGKYRSAIVELEKAYGLDPTGKDLVYNLAVVYEKLGELDSSIHYLERYIALEPDPGEVERANDAIRRLRGARAELASERREQPPQPSRPCPPAPAPPPARPGKLDEWVVVSGGVAIVSALVGTVFGLRALTVQPDADDVTGAGESREELRERINTAKDLARVADVAFAVSVASGATAAVLYFGRSAGPEGTATLGFAGRF